MASKKRSASPIDSDDESASKKPTIKPKCQFGPSCYRKNPDHIRDYDHTPTAATPSPPPVVATPTAAIPSVAASSSSSSSGAAAPAVADITKPHCSFGAKCYRKNPQHRLDEYHPPAPVPFDAKKFYANVVNAEQKFAWEHGGKKELTKAVGSALGHAMINDLQKIAVNVLEPSFSNTFKWRLKEIDLCGPGDWKKNKAKSIIDKSEVERDDDGGDGGDDDDEAEPNDGEDGDENDEDDDYDDDEDDSTSKKKKGKVKPAKGKGKSPVKKKRGSKKGPVESPPPFVSKIGGLPYLKSNEDWPVCGDCEKGLPFMFQLLLSDFPEFLGLAYQLPGVPLDKQLFQFFLCNAGGSECETFEPYNSGTFVRILDISDYDESQYKSSTLKKTKDVILLNEHLLIGWTKHRDYPHSEDFDLYGLKLPDDIDPDVEDELCDKYNAVQGEKLSGFPCFVQGAEYPNCSNCSKKMRFMFQINGDTWTRRGTEIMLGDCGEGHIYQCPDHPEILAFNWACS